MPHHTDEGSPLSLALARSAIPTREQERILIARAQAGDLAALHALVEGNLRLVASIAARYRRRGCHELDDLIAEGTLGFMRAVLRFDLGTPYKLSTYATWWVRQAIGQALLDRADVVRRPRGHADRTPLCRASLDMPVRSRNGDDDACTLGDLLADPDAEQPDEPAARRELREHVHAALARLPARDRLVVTLRFGIRDDGTAGYRATLDEVGRILRVSRERVRQLELRALRRLARRLAATPHAAAAS